MPGSFDLTGATGPLCVSVSAPFVFLYNPDAEQPFEWLPNIVYLGSSVRIGPVPSTATFAYIQDDALDLNLGWPSRIDQIWAPTASGPYVVSPDDRLVVIEPNPDGSSNFLFDGFAQIPQADVTPQSERASFSAVGVEAREYDQPVSGRTQRNADSTGIQDTTGKSDVMIDLPCRFNPADESYGDDGGFQPNKSPAQSDTQPVDGQGNSTGPAHPVFAQSGIEGRPATQSPAYWTIADAIKYLLAEYQDWTEYPNPELLDTLLASVYTANLLAGQAINPGDITSDPLLIRDYDASNRPWPEVVAELLAFVGFQMRWDLQADSNMNPVTYLRIYRADMLSDTPIKEVYLDDPGNSLAQGSPNNAARIHLARDSNSIVNAWQVETSQQLIEITVYLVPLYEPQAGDQTPVSGSTTTGLAQFYTPNLDANNATAIVRRKYRWYGVDELGEGYWDGVNKAMTTQKPFDFGQVFPPNADGSPSYVVRYRPAVHQVAALDSLGRPLHARLDIAFGVSNSEPIFGFTNPAIKWFPVPQGWRLLKDRLGIRVNSPNPEQWASGNKDIAGGEIRGVSWWVAPPDQINYIPTNGYPPTFRLTCLIQDDLRMPISVAKRPASPTKFSRWRTVDSRDHFQYSSIDLSSVNYTNQGGNGTDPLVIRDDTQAATAYAYALQRAHEMPPLAGSITMPGIITYYEVGDRIDAIAGRNIPLYRDAGLTLGESPTYPMVVGRDIRGDDEFQTTLQLSDLRAAPDRNPW